MQVGIRYLHIDLVEPECLPFLLMVGICVIGHGVVHMKLWSCSSIHPILSTLPPYICHTNNHSLFPDVFYCRFDPPLDADKREVVVFEPMPTKEQLELTGVRMEESLYACVAAPVRDAEEVDVHA